MCPKDSPCGTEASPHHVVSLVDLVPAELRSRALNVRSALSDRLISVQEFHERVLQARASLFANTEVTIARFHEDIAAVKAELDAKADRLVREVTVVRDERVKALDNQISELNVSMEQHRAGLELCSRVLDSECAPDKACHFVNSAVSLGSVPVAEATVRASDCLQILFDMKSVLDRVEPSFSVRYAAVDSNRSEVNGDGMSGFLRGFENEFSIVCMDTAGQYMDTVTEKDISVELTGRLADGTPALSSTGDVADVGRVVVSPVKISDTGRVRTPWLFSVRYSVEAADIVAVVLGIRVCGVLVGDHEWLVPLCRLNRLAVHQLGSERVGDGGNPNSIAASRLLQTRMRLSNKRTCFCVSPDESVLVTIARDSETAPELSVYSLPECVLVCQFRLRFRNIFGPPDPVAPCIHQFCFSPRAGSSTNPSIMWCDDRFHSASRMSAVVREARLNLQMGSGSQIRSLPCAGAQCVDANTDVIVVGCSPSVSGSPDNPIVSGVIRVFSFAEGALMREFPVSISHMVREVPSPLLPVLLSTDGQSIYILIDPAVVSHSITGEFIRQDFCVECDYDLSEELTADVAILTGFALLEKGFLVVCQRLDLIGSHLALPDSQLNLIDLADVESGYASIGSQYLGTAHAMSSRCLVASRGPRVYVLDLHNNSVTTYTYSPPCSPPAVTVRVEASAAQSSASHADDV